MKPVNAAALLAEVEAIAVAAGELILSVYAQPFAVQTKADHSQLTEADERSEAHITPALQALLPDVPVVAEEAVSRSGAPQVGRSFWLVDPLDGTREFVLRNGEFTVNIALVEDGVPVLGVVYAPALGRMFAGVAGARADPASPGAWLQDAAGRRRIACRTCPAQGATMAVSRAHGHSPALEAWLSKQNVFQRLPAGSALKFGLLAAGEADVYPRFGRTMEWDTAAGHAVLMAAGGQVLDLQGLPLRYGKPGFDNPDFVAICRAR